MRFSMRTPIWTRSMGRLRSGWWMGASGMAIGASFSGGGPCFEGIRSVTYVTCYILPYLLDKSKDHDLTDLGKRM
jgi:hypothetical protein